MKKVILSFLVMASAMIAFAGCSNDETVGGGAGLSTEFVVSRSDMQFAKNGGESQLFVKAGTVPTVSSEAAWLTITPVAGTSSVTHAFMVQAQPNTDNNDRTATISVSAGSDSKTISVTQNSTEGLVVTSAKALAVAAEGGQVSVTLQANADYEEVISNGWVTEVTSRANMVEYTHNYTVAANNGDERTATISYTLEVNDSTSITEAVTINQAKGEGAGMTHNAKELAKLINLGINIGNTMECPEGEGTWNGGTKVNEAYIRGLKAAGFNAVRIPCAWNSHLSNESTYEIDAAWMSRVKEVVTWCVQNDLYVILNAHWDGGWLEDNIFDASKEAAITAEQKAIWTQIATNFNSFDEHLLFAACNEPGMNETSGGGKSWKTDATAQQRVIKYEQTMIDAVRATGGNNATRVLIMPGLGVSISDIAEYQTSLPTDQVADRLMVEAHFYEPYQFALMEEDASWGKMYYFWGKDNKVSGSERNTPDEYAEAWVDGQMKKMYDKYASKGIPVILGEFSAMFRNLDANQVEHDKSVAYYGEYVAKVAKNNGCVPFYWETGSVINRTDGTVKKQAVVDGLVKGASEGKYPW